jgi:hypothetical protein
VSRYDGAGEIWLTGTLCEALHLNGSDNNPDNDKVVIRYCELKKVCSPVAAVRAAVVS